MRKVRNVKEKVISCINDEPLKIEISRKKYGLLDCLLFRRKKRIFYVRPPVLGDILRISGIVENINISAEDIEKQPFEFGIKYLNKNKDDMVMVVAYALHSKRTEPNEGLIRFINENLTNQELLILVSAILNLLNVKDFSSSTMLVQNMSLMKQRELIALQNAISGRQLEA